MPRVYAVEKMFFAMRNEFDANVLIL